jgi:hypothetical protein
MQIKERTRINQLSANSDLRKRQKQLESFGQTDKN